MTFNLAISREILKGLCICICVCVCCNVPLPQGDGGCVYKVYI